MPSAVDEKSIGHGFALGGQPADSTAADSPAPGAWTPDDDESIGVLKLAGTLALLMVVAQVVYNLAEGGPDAAGAVMAIRWTLILASCGFLGLLWTDSFKRHVRFWTLSYFAFLFAAVTAASHFTRNPESRFVVIILFPIVTAGFITWGPRSQLIIGAMAVFGYLIANLLVPIPGPFDAYRWVGLLGVTLFAICTSFLIDRYRQRLAGQVRDLEAAARFRQGQISTMSHDIRSPAAALSGYANLLEEETITDRERAEVLARIGATAWRMDLVVGNVLDYYDAQERALAPIAADIDPNPLLAEVAADCAMQARRRGVGLRTEFSRLPRCRLDPRHLERIVKNLLAFAIGRMVGGEVVLHTAIHGEAILIDVADKGPALTAAEMQSLFERPADGRGRSAGGLGLYLARMMAETAGGHIDARLGGRGLSLAVELPAGTTAPDAKPASE
ncbi:MAG: sensor histidine kinase [Candidatus Binataceae bacterium]